MLQSLDQSRLNTEFGSIFLSAPQTEWKGIHERVMIHGMIWLEWSLRAFEYYYN